MTFFQWLAGVGCGFLLGFLFAVKVSLSIAREVVIETVDENARKSPLTAAKDSDGREDLGGNVVRCAVCLARCRTDPGQALPVGWRLTEKNGIECPECWSDDVEDGVAYGVDFFDVLGKD